MLAGSYDAYGSNDCHMLCGINFVVRAVGWTSLLHARVDISQQVPLIHSQQCKYLSGWHAFITCPYS